MLALHLLKSHTKAIRHVPQIITYVTVEKKIKNKGNLFTTMIQTLKLLQLAKGTTRDKATLISEKITPVTIVIIKLRLSEGISKLVGKKVSQSVSQSASQQKILLNKIF